MEELLETFEIGRSLSMKGCPYDNAVAEATYKIMKTEFVNQMTFQSLRHLELELYDYVNWFNKHRIHGTLDYMTPVQYRQEALKKKLSDFLLTIHISLYNKTLGRLSLIFFPNLIGCTTFEQLFKK